MDTAEGLLREWLDIRVPSPELRRRTAELLAAAEEAELMRAEGEVLRARPYVAA